jgi:ParB family chromosome partitioning protein
LIQLKGYVQPLTVKTDGTIVSGHRRWRALAALGWKFVPVIVCHFQSENDELFVLVAENRHRYQSPVQRIREGIVVEPIAREHRNRHATKKARHQAAGSAEPPSDNQQPLMENFPLNPHSAPSTVTRAFPCSFAIETPPLARTIKYKYLIVLA